jgi:hypothetical protein
MIRTALAAAALLFVAACADRPADPPEPVAEPSIDPTAKAKAVKTADDLLDFSYVWPVEASSIPALNQRLEAELTRDRAEAEATAREDQASRGTEYPFNGHYFNKSWQRYGESRRLLSLAAEVSTFTGGAHGNSGFDQILWDRQARGAIEPLALFADAAAANAALTPLYCAALDRERAQKRQETLPLSGEGWMVECPALTDQALVPLDQNGDGRFERLRVMIAPYEAGPYAEGSYEFDIEVTDAIRRMLKADYRESF